jgi:hypothetical protein
LKLCGMMLSGLVGCLVDVKVMVRLVIMMVVGVGPSCGGVLLRGRQAGGVRAPRRAGSLVSVSAMPSSLPPLCSAWRTRELRGAYATLPPMLWREETPAEDPWKAGCWRARPRWGEGTGCYACTSLGACGAGWVNLRVCVGAIAFLEPSSVTSPSFVLANKWGRRAGGAASSAVAYPASPRRAPSKRGDRLEHRALPARRAGS